MDIVLIGLGRIARYHIAALLSTPRYRLCGLCDIRETRVSQAHPEFTLFTDYEQLLDRLDPAAAVIATPPSTHEAIVAACLQRGVLPMVEKPLAEHEEEGRRFLSPEWRGRYVPIHHTLYGEEILWFMAHCPLQRIDAIRMELSDPYADEHGCIDPERYGLGGCWLDSAPNALAPLLRLLGGRKLTQVEVSHTRDAANGQPYRSRMQARAGETEVLIEVNWQTTDNCKLTTILADGHQYVLQHTDQAVWRDGELLFRYDAQERLMRQYTNFYTMYPEGVPTPEEIETIYRIIYANR